jgi:preprotein translocase subunit SecD
MMRTYAVSFIIMAALSSLLCGATASCVTPGVFESRDAGGVQMILAVKAEPAALEQAVQNASQVIRMRCDSLGVQCQVERQGGEGSNRIRLRVSGARDFGRVKAVLLAEGRLELRPVVSPLSPSPMKVYPTREAAEKEAGQKYDVLPYEDADMPTVFLTVEREPVVTGTDLREASAVAETDYDGEKNYIIAFTLRPEGAMRLGEWTGANVGRYLAIILNGKVRSVPYIKSRITDSGQITGNFSKEQAEDIALTLRSGNMPAPVEVLEEGAYKP